MSDFEFDRPSKREVYTEHDTAPRSAGEAFEPQLDISPGLKHIPKGHIALQGDFTPATPES